VEDPIKPATAAPTYEKRALREQVSDFFRYKPTVPNESIAYDERQRSMRKVIVAWCMGSIFFNGITGAPLVGMFRELGASVFGIGLLAAIYPFATLAQLLASYAIARTGSRKRMFIWGAYPGRLIWIPIVALAFFLPPGTGTVAALFCLVLFGRLSDSLSGLAWFSWVSDLVPEEERGNFWGTRQMWGYVFGITTSIALGYYLGTSPPFHKFVVFFCIVAIFGWLDVFIHRGVTGIRFHVPAARQTLAQMIWQPLRDTNFRPLVIFTTLFGFSCQLGGGLFQLMLLEEIKLSYFEISLYLAGLLGGVSMISSKLWGHLMDNLREGERLVFMACAVIVALIALPWSMIGARQHLPITVNIAVSGLGWAGYQIALTGLLIAYSPPGSRATYFAVHAVATGFGNALGAVVSGWLAESFAGLEVIWGPFKLTQLRTLYLISGLARLLCLFLLPIIRKPDSHPIGVYVRRLLSLSPFSWGTYVYVRGKLSGRGPQGQQADVGLIS